MNASSLSLAGSISAKAGTRRRNSNSCCRLTCFLPLFPAPRALSFRGHQEGRQRILLVELGWPALLLQLAAAHHQNSIEIAREAGAMQHPEQAAPGHFLPQSLARLGLRRPVERGRRLVEDQE